MALRSPDPWERDAAGPDLAMTTRGHAIEVRLTDDVDGPGDLDQVRDLLHDLALAEPILDRERGTIRMEVVDGLRALAEVARRLEAAGLSVEEVRLSRPAPTDLSQIPVGKPGRPIKRRGHRPGGTPA